MQSTVWHADLSARPGRGLVEKTGEILRAAGLAAKVRARDLAAVKLHFGEPGNASFSCAEELGLGSRDYRLEAL